MTRIHKKKGKVVGWMTVEFDSQDGSPFVRTGSIHPTIKEAERWKEERAIVCALIPVTQRKRGKRG